MVAISVMLFVVYACQSSYTHTTKVYNTTESHEVDVRCYPATIVQVLQVVASFMVATNKYGSHWCNLLAIVVAMKRGQRPVRAQCVQEALNFGS
jgi:hypothetical protein